MRAQRTVTFRIARDDAPEGSSTLSPRTQHEHARARVQRAGALPRQLEESWSMAQFAGRLGEISGVGAVARLSLAIALVLDAQQRNEPVAWIAGPTSAFFPPDAAAAGVDLNTLPVIVVPDSAAAARTAAQLARSGAFGLLVIDLAATREQLARQPAPLSVPPPLLTRLVGLAQQHGTGVVFLTDSTAKQPSLGSLISLRVEAQRQAVGDGCFLCSAHALKDKRRGPGWNFSAVHFGPAGLR